MKIVLYCNRNVGLIALSHLVSLGHEVSVICDKGEENISWLAERLGCEILSFDGGWGEFDLFLCVHGRKLIPKERLIDGKFVNVHPLLEQELKGKDPVARFLKSKLVAASVSSHYMTAIPDEGEIIETVYFKTDGVKDHAGFYNEALKWYFVLIDKTITKILN